MRYIFLLLIGLVIADQIGVRLADRAIRNRQGFFETVLENADLSVMFESDSSSYQECQIHPVFLVYYAKTCFDNWGWINPSDHGERVEIGALMYWPPLSKTFSYFSDYYYNEPCCFETVFSITRGKKIRKDYRIDGLLR